MRARYLLIIGSLLGGLLIYLFYRTERTLINEIALRLFEHKKFFLLREHVRSLVPLSKIIIYSLPGGLWVFCVTLTSLPFYIQIGNRQLHCAIIPPLFAVGIELFQLAHITNGRFDPLDIAVAISFWSIAFYFFDNQNVRQNLLKPVRLNNITCVASYCIVYLSHVVQ